MFSQPLILAAAEIDVTIPPCLVAGDYLMRIQQVAIHVPGGAAQFHVSCAQIKIVGEGRNLPAEQYHLKIPGFVKRDDVALRTNIFVNFKEYAAPGGRVWKC